MSTYYPKFTDKFWTITSELSQYIDNLYYYEDSANINIDRSPRLLELSSLLNDKAILNENLDQILDKTNLNTQDTILNYLLYILSIDYLNLDEKKVKKISNGFLTSYIASRYDYNQEFKNQLSLIKNFINTNKNWGFEKGLDKDEIKLEKMNRLDNLFIAVAKIGGNVIVPPFLTKTGQIQDLDTNQDDIVKNFNAPSYIRLLDFAADSLRIIAVCLIFIIKFLFTIPKITIIIIKSAWDILLLIIVLVGSIGFLVFLFLVFAKNLQRNFWFFNDQVNALYSNNLLASFLFIFMVLAYLIMKYNLIDFSDNIK